MVRVSPKSVNQPNEMTLTISNNCCRLMRDWELESLRNGKEISAVPFRTEKEVYLWRYVYNFRSDFPEKFPSHFNCNQNFGIILLNGKPANFPENLFKNCILPTEVVLFFCSVRSSGKFLTICLTFHFPVSHLWKTIANGKRYLIRLVS